jgi:hypothetical protein
MRGEGRFEGKLRLPSAPDTSRSDDVLFTSLLKRVLMHTIMSLDRDKETAVHNSRNQVCGTLKRAVSLSIPEWVALKMQDFLYCSAKATVDSSNMMYNRVAKKASDETRSNARR